MSNHMHNVAALMRDDMTTLSAEFVRGSGQTYEFKVSRALADTVNPGDWVLCRAQQQVKTVHVTAVHREPQIDPDAEFIYQWAFQRVEIETLDELRAEDDALVEELNRHRRKQVRDGALAALGIDDPSTLLQRAQQVLEGEK